MTSIPPPSFFRERAWIWATGIMFTAFGSTVAALFLGLFTPLGARIAAIWTSPEANAAAFAALAERLDMQAAVLDDLRAAVSRANGEDKVMRQIPNLSYVVEPVYQGEPVTMIMVAERTTLGRDCRLSEWVPLFSDDRGIIIPGAPANGPGTVRRQITDERTRLEIQMLPPDRLQPGRIEVYLDLTYTCPSGVIAQATDPVIYELIAETGNDRDCPC